MNDLVSRAREWMASDPDPATRSELQGVIDGGDTEDLARRMDTVLTFGTAGIRGQVGAGPGMMNRAVVMRTTFGLATYLGSKAAPVVVGFDARPDSCLFAEDTAGVLAAAGLKVVFFPDVTPTPLVAFAAKHLGAAAAVVVTASHNPPADNGYKVYGENASQIVPPVDSLIQRYIEAAPGASDVPRIENAFGGESPLVTEAPADVVDRYWEGIARTRIRESGSDLSIVYTPIHGVGRDLLMDMMRRAGHRNVAPVASQAEPDGTFPTVAFPNPEEPGALDLALEQAASDGADLVLANDPDADRLAVVVPSADGWRPLTGNEIGVLLGDYLLRADPSPESAIVASSIVSSPMLARIARSLGAHHAVTLTGFKWIVEAGMQLERELGGRFIYGYEEALGYTVGSTVRDKDGISAAVVFADLTADTLDQGETVQARLAHLWRAHGLWVSAQVSITRSGPEGLDALRDCVNRLAGSPPAHVDDIEVTEVTDYRHGGEERPPWLGEQSLVELALGDEGRVLVRPSGTEPKLKIYVDLVGEVLSDPEEDRAVLLQRAMAIGRAVEGSLVV